MMEFEVEAVHPKTGDSKRFRVKTRNTREAERAVKRKGYLAGHVRLVDPYEDDADNAAAPPPDLEELDDLSQLANAVEEAHADPTHSSGSGLKHASRSRSSASRNQRSGARPAIPAGSEVPMPVAAPAQTAADADARRSERKKQHARAVARADLRLHYTYWACVTAAGILGFIGVVCFALAAVDSNGRGVTLVALSLGLITGTLLLAAASQIIHALRVLLTGKR